MSTIIWQTLLVIMFALIGWYMTDKFAPDDLLNKILKFAIFGAVAYWVIFHLIPKLGIA